MSGGVGPGDDRDLENALLRRALLSAVAATNAAFEAIVALTGENYEERREQLQQALVRGTENLDEALAYIKEAQDVRHHS